MGYHLEPLKAATSSVPTAAVPSYQAQIMITEYGALAVPTNSQVRPQAVAALFSRVAELARSSGASVMCVSTMVPTGVMTTMGNYDGSVTLLESPFGIVTPEARRVFASRIKIVPVKEGCVATTEDGRQSLYQITAAGIVDEPEN
jgi:hypothetical protein